MTNDDNELDNSISLEISRQLGDLIEKQRLRLRAELLPPGIDQPPKTEGSQGEASDQTSATLASFAYYLGMMLGDYGETKTALEELTSRIAELEDSLSRHQARIEELLRDSRPSVD